MKHLKLAPTISTPTVSDVPLLEETLGWLKRREAANIVEGYIILDNLSNEYLHNFSAEINVDNDRLWLVIKALVMQMSDTVALIYHHIDDEPSYGNYVDKFELINLLEQYTTELTMDGFLNSELFIIVKIY